MDGPYLSKEEKCYIESLSISVRGEVLEMYSSMNRNCAMISRIGPAYKSHCTCTLFILHEFTTFLHFNSFIHYSKSALKCLNTYKIHIELFSPIQ